MQDRESLGSPAAYPLIEGAHAAGPPQTTSTSSGAVPDVASLSLEFDYKPTTRVITRDNSSTNDMEAFAFRPSSALIADGERVVSREDSTDNEGGLRVRKSGGGGVPSSSSGGQGQGGYNGAGEGS